MTEFKDIIIDWLIKKATKEEIGAIYEVIKGQIDWPENRLILEAKYAENDHPEKDYKDIVAAVKLIKEKTGWSLKESKLFYDEKVKNFVIPPLVKKN